MIDRISLSREQFVWSGIGMGGFVLVAIAPATAYSTIEFAVWNLLLMAPVIALATTIAAGVRATGLDGMLGRAFSERGATAVVISSAIGAVTPICGVGVLPIIAGLLGAGVPLAPVMAFWLASPITDPAMLTITAGTLGLSFAVGKTVLAGLIGLAGGFATAALVGLGAFRNPLKGRALNACTSSPGDQPVCLAFWREPERVALFKTDALQAAWLMLKWLSLAFLVEGLMHKHLSSELVASIAGQDNAWAIPAAVTIGAPIYLDGYAALPLVRGLLDMGMAPGAAMAFLIAGGVTSLYASVAVFALVRWPVFATYIALALILSLLSGYMWAFAVPLLST